MLLATAVRTVATPPSLALFANSPFGSKKCSIGPRLLISTNRGAGPAAWLFCGSMVRGASISFSSKHNRPGRRDRVTLYLRRKLLLPEVVLNIAGQVGRLSAS